MGFGIGNTIQAVAFGLVHSAIALNPGVDKTAVACLVVLAAVTGWINGWLNERMGNGSILPGWAMHGSANLVTYLSLALLLR
jgi:hypothetical protein